MSKRVPVRHPSPHATPITRRTALLSGLALPLGLLAARATPAAAAQSASPAGPARLTLPVPTGPYRLGTTSLYLIDKSRPDPWVPAIRFRGLVIQIWYPAHAVDGYPRVPYFTPKVARAYEKQLGLSIVLNWPMTHAHLGAPVHQREGGWPVVLYSPGLGNEGNETTCLVEELASRGYVVVTIDHIHDSGVVELPDGTLEFVAVPPAPAGRQPADH